MSRTVACADCGGSVGPARVRCHVTEAAIARVLCPGCATRRDGRHVYQPEGFVPASRIDLTDRGRDGGRSP